MTAKERPRRSSNCRITSLDLSFTYIGIQTRQSNSFGNCGRLTHFFGGFSAPLRWFHIIL